MIVLGIETAGPRPGVALLFQDRVRERWCDAKHGLGAELAPAIQELLAEEGLGPDAPPDLVAVDLGPGSYTGLRVGLAAAKGLAFAWGRPLVGVRGIDALAVQAAALAPRVLCAIDAQRGEVYHALFERPHFGRRPVQLTGPALGAPEAIAASVPDDPALCLVGDAADAVARSFGAGGRTPAKAPEALAWPSARLVAELGRERHLSGERDDAIGLAPVYYRPSEAEERRRKRARAGEGA